MRIDAFSPLVHVIWAAPPGRRSIVAALPNHAPRPSAVVSAAHTLAGGCAMVPGLVDTVAPPGQPAVNVVEGEAPQGRGLGALLEQVIGLAQAGWGAVLGAVAGPQRW